jgi:hypothetical protein
LTKFGYIDSIVGVAFTILKLYLKTWVDKLDFMEKEEHPRKFGCTANISPVTT